MKLRSKIFTFALFALAAGLLSGFLLQEKISVSFRPPPSLPATGVVRNKSLQSFAAAMESWKKLNSLDSVRPSMATPNLKTEEIKALLEKTVAQLQACDRNELENLYPGWGANRDLFLSAAFGYLESLERQELRTRDLRESDEKLQSLFTWVDHNRETLERKLPIKWDGLFRSKALDL